jgi:hypothetical protein
MNKKQFDKVVELERDMNGYMNGYESISPVTVAGDTKVTFRYKDGSRTIFKLDDDGRVIEQTTTTVVTTKYS